MHKDLKKNISYVIPVLHLNFVQAVQVRHFFMKHVTINQDLKKPKLIF